MPRRTGLGCGETGGENSRPERAVCGWDTSTPEAPNWPRGWSSRHPNSATRTGLKGRDANPSSSTSTILLIWALRRAVQCPASAIGFGTVADGLDRSEPARETIDASVVVEILEQQRAEGRHDCAQCYVSVGGEPLLDVADRRVDPRPGPPHRRPDALVLVGQAAHHGGRPPALGAGAARARRPRRRLHRRLGQRQGAVHAPPRAHPHRRVPDVPATSPSTRTSRTPRRSARIAAHPADWVPGTAASYHPVTGWKVLGAIVEAVDGRPIDRYLREEIIGPLGMTNSSLGIPLDAQPELGDRIVPVTWTGHRLPNVDGDGALSMAAVPHRPSSTTSRGTSPRWSPAVGCGARPASSGASTSRSSGYGPTASSSRGRSR